MSIEQPKQQGRHRPLRFWARCPMCWRILACDDGMWPEHLWDPRGTYVCSTSGTKHETLETK